MEEEEELDDDTKLCQVVNPVSQFEGGPGGNVHQVRTRIDSEALYGLQQQVDFSLVFFSLIQLLLCMRLLYS